MIIQTHIVDMISQKSDECQCQWTSICLIVSSQIYRCPKIWKTTGIYVSKNFVIYDCIFSLRIQAIKILIQYKKCIIHKSSKKLTSGNSLSIINTKMISTNTKRSKCNDKEIIDFFFMEI